MPVKNDGRHPAKLSNVETISPDATVPANPLGNPLVPGSSPYLAWIVAARPGFQSLAWGE